MEPEAPAAPETGAEPEAGEAEQAETELQDSDAASDEAGDGNEPEDAERNLFLETLPADIRTASFYDLIDWTARLGLSTRGSRRDLQNRIAEYYDIPLSSVRPAEGAGEGREVVIESANQSEYFTLDSVEEQYVRLRGNVRLRTRGDRDSAVHMIEAEEIIFNREENNLTAVGNVRYRIDREGEVEEFTGSTLSFELDSWEGQFLQGVSSRERDVEGEQIRFRYSGEYMTRTREDIVVMEDGVITSSTANPPSYSIRAERIWVLGAGEWAIRGARLYVGRVPILVFPFFFKPGDEVFFNPVAGSRDREGAFIQTTTYVLGEKEKEDSAISFLQVAGDEPTGPREREGLFLTTVAGRQDGQDPERERQRDVGTVKVLFDVYSKLGVYAGVDADLNNLGAGAAMQGSLGVAASRHLYPADSGDGSLSPYRIVDEEAQQDWNSTSFLGTVLPFRYLLDVTGRARESWFSGNAGVELYSDPFVELDFGDRAEDMDWLGLLSNEEEGDTATGVAQKNRLRWESSFRLNPSVEALQPWVRSVSIREIGASLDWQSRDRADPPEEIALADRSPEQSFFYPTRSVLPSVGLSADGTLVSIPWTRRQAREARDGDRGRSVTAGFRPPWESGEEHDDDEPDDEDAGYRTPDIRSVSGGVTYPQAFESSLGYRLTSTTTVENTYDDDEWARPEDVTFDYAYSSVTTNNSGRLTYGSKLMERLVTLDGSVEATGRYREIYNHADPAAQEIESVVEQAARYSSFGLQNSASAALAPVPEDTPLADSKLEYRLTTDLFRIVYDQEVSAEEGQEDPVYRNESFEWSDEYVTAHSLGGIVTAAILDNDQSLRLSTTLPPLERTYEGRLTASAGPWNGNVRVAATAPEAEEDPETGEVTEPEDTLVFDPISASQRLSFLENGAISQTLLYDVEEEYFERLTLGLKGSIGSVDFQMRRSKEVAFERNFIQQGLSSPWVEREEEELRPASARGTASYELDPLPLWKNRVTFDATASTTVEANLQRFTESSLTLRAGLNFAVHEFLELSFNSTSRNDFLYQYIPALAERVDRRVRNPLVDVARSFNFFNPEDREASFFNLQSLSVEATHRLGDWDLVLAYSARPALSQDVSPPRYEWDSRFSVVVQWRPLPELRSEVSYEDEELQYRTGE